MEFRTKVDIEALPFRLQPCEEMLFVGSCFADNIGHIFIDEKFRAIVNPYGVMYNPVSILHTVERLKAEGRLNSKISVFTLGTNHVYRLKETGEIVDNCQKRPQSLFQEDILSIEQCVDALRKAISMIEGQVLLTVSPIRYRKYGYHNSQLSKATLLLAVQQLVDEIPEKVSYFPAYEIVNDELRDYRFYQPDMLHPSMQAVEYIYGLLAEACFAEETKEFLKEWHPIKAALEHRPFNPEAEEYKEFMKKTMQKVESLKKRYPNFAL